MVCNLCGHEEFVTREYRSEMGCAPALECTKCKALNLVEEAANTAEERDSVRRVIAMRDAFADARYDDEAYQSACRAF